MTFSLICCFYNLLVRDRKSLKNIINISLKIIGVKRTDLGSFKDQAHVQEIYIITIYKKYMYMFNAAI